MTYTGIDNQTYNHLPYPLPGRHQAINTAIALATLEVLHKKHAFQLAFTDVPHNLLQVCWPGRLERIQVCREAETFTYLFDGAHNEAGIRTLSNALHDLGVGQFVLVWGSMKDKTLATQWQALLKRADNIIFTQAEPERSARPEQLFALADQAVRYRIRCRENVVDALKLAELTARHHMIICVAGSLHLVGKARSLIVNTQTT
ncbi:MAG: hypothetical protein CSA26_10290 [Desulfobacterales bacterium]|nr:MAG: hypothetical protein CSA26_10290 [Desulfobacterales bacterium]